MLRNILRFKKVDDSILRPLGAGVAILIPLIIGLLLNNMVFAQFATLGAFSYLSFQRNSIYYNIKSTTFHGAFLIISFLLGIAISKNIWLLPFVISLLSIIGFLFSKIYQIPKPAHFFVLMIFATGTNIKLLPMGVLTMTLYLCIGVCSGILNAVLISFCETLPWKLSKSKFHKLNFKDKYYVLIYKSPKVWIDAIYFAFILFIAGYISYLLRDNFGYWVLISSAAVLSGEEIEIIKHRYLGRIFGSVIGGFLGLLIMALHPTIIGIIFILITLNILTEYFMPRNYAVANFFSNPLVLLLSLLTSAVDPTFLMLERLNGVVIGSLVTILLVTIMHFSLRINNMEY